MFQMPEKAATATTWTSLRWWNPMLHWGFKVLTLAFFLGILTVWSINGFDLSGFHRYFLVLKLTNAHKDYSLKDFSSQLNFSFHHKSHLNLTSLVDPNQTLAQEILVPDIVPPASLNLTETPENAASTVSNLTQNQPNLTYFSPQGVVASHNLTLTPENAISEPANLTQNQPNLTDFSPQVVVSCNYSDHNITQRSPSPKNVGWISAELEPDYSEKLLRNWLAPGGQPCKDSRTVDINIPKLDGRDHIELSTGEVHEFVFQALDDSGKPHCQGGDYFETDLSGDFWKSRPPVKHLGNGTCTFSLQVHPNFPGNYNLTIILLFRHYEGLKFSPERFTFDRILRTIGIKFNKSSAQLPEIKQCKKSDLTRDVWSGRWTRHARNDMCSISDDGRYRCQEPDFPCENPWCEGPLGMIESNGWIYSTHCSFKLFSDKESWKCLNKRWIFWWGDSNHCDTIRNILNFIMNVQDIKSVPRLFDMNITNPNNSSQKIRFTSIFNGHHNSSGNYLGLNSLSNEAYRDLLRGYFSQEVVPDTVIMNSGLHDGVYWSNIRNFIKGADYAAKFWAEVLERVRRRGMEVPEVIYRTTVATGGYARRLAFNPDKMEAFNGVVLDKMRQYGVVSRVIDNFDMTYTWHYDNRCNDGVHYGRAPLKMKWRDGQIGHQYFVDLMLGHVLLNALCAL